MKKSEAGGKVGAVGIAIAAITTAQQLFRAGRYLEAGAVTIFGIGALLIYEVAQEKQILKHIGGE
jgi:hypothetical protein